MTKFDLIKTSIQRHYGIEDFNIRVEQHSGGDIHQSFAVTLQFEHSSVAHAIPNRLFAKINEGIGARVLNSEFESLNQICSIFPKRYPHAILFDQYADQALLLMSFHSLSTVDPVTAMDAGQALARQHQLKSTNFGWPTDNYIGLTPQSNQWNKDWIAFFRDQRLKPMLTRAAEQGLPPALSNDVRKLILELDDLLSHEVTPSLLHGDLWSGNLGYDKSNQQTLFYDPAPYYGDREVDLSMTELFGRQADSFYEAYQQTWPLSHGYQQRRSVYNLYHALNHVVLFGASYHQLVKSCLDQV